MSYFDLDPRADADTLTWAMQNPAVAPGTSFFDGAATALPRGLWSGVVAKPALLLGDAGDAVLHPIAKGIDEMFGGTSAVDFLVRDRQKRIDMVKNTMPDARMGLAGQVLYGAGDIIPSAVAGAVVAGPGGGATFAGAVQGYADMRLSQEDGIDTTTAAGQGVITGLAAAIGVLLPGSVGANLLKSIGVGAAGNVGVGIAQRGAISELLERRGYTERAQQYKAFDTEAVLTDALIGAAVGGSFAGYAKWRGARAAGQAPDIPEPVVDSALAANAVQHVDVGVAPGIPANPMAQAAHTKAINKAVSDLMAAQEVDVSATGVADAGFVPVRSEMRAAVAAVMDQLHPLGKALNDVDALRAEVEALGLTPPDDPILTGRPLVESTVNGRRAEVFVGDRPEPVRFEVVEADALAPQFGKAENQYRDRTRQASEIQIQKIAQNLQFGRLGDAPTMAEGAPTLAADGRIVGGNGRVAAVSRAYELGTASDYRAHLEARAAEFGVDAATIQAMDKPVLVRRFERDVNVRQAAILSNEAGGLRMSALEQAKVDAERMPALRDLVLPENGDLTAPSARDFLRRWMANMPLEQQAGLVGADGRVSSEGVLRARNGILYHAYGDSPTLARLVESSDEAQRNVANALVRAAPNVADARQAIEVGELHDRDIQPQLMQAVEKFSELRATDMSVDEFVNQGDMFGNGIGAEAVSWMRFMEANKRSAKAISEAITGYYDAVRALGNPKQADIFAADPPSRAAILSALLDKNNSKGQASLFDEAAAPVPLKTETPEFKKWFGESKVVGEDGKPLVVYHGTTASFDSFKPETGWFSASPDEANVFGGQSGDGANVVPAFVKIERPRIIDGEKESNWRSAISDALTDGTIDGVIVTRDGKPAWVVPSEPSQIKSSVGNSGKFDPNSASLTDGKYGGRIERAKELPPEQRAIEARFADWILADVNRAIEAYAAHPESDGGKILNTDIARDLSPDYNASKDTRSMLSAAVHEPASWLVKEMYARKLAEKPKAGERAVVAFTAGGTGAGKSTAIENVAAARAAVGRSQIIYDTNMNTYASAADRIRQALEAGKKVEFMYVARDPVVALTEGALPRAMRQGRTVPIAEHAKTHKGSRDVAMRLLDEFKDEPNFHALIVDNTGAKGSQRVADIAMLKQIDYNDLEARLKAALESEFKNGRITETVYRGTIGGDAKPAGMGKSARNAGSGADGGDGRAVRQELPGVRGDSGRGTGGESSPEYAGADANTVGQIIESTPNAKLVDDAGEIRTAQVALAEADATIAMAEKDAAGYDAAVACFLRG